MKKPSLKYVLVILAIFSALLGYFIITGNGNSNKDNVSKFITFNVLPAEQGNADAQYNLAVMYAEGQGIAKDLSKAYLWASLAAIQNNQYAEFRNEVEKGMTPEQIEAGQRQIHEWQSQHPKQ